MSISGITVIFLLRAYSTTSLSILSAFIQLASKLIYANDDARFVELKALMDLLSGSGSGLGHFYLFQACCIWLDYFDANLKNDADERKGEEDEVEDNKKVIAF